MIQPREGEIVTAKCQKCDLPFQGTYSPLGLPPFNCPHCDTHHTGMQFLVAVTDHRASLGPDTAPQPSFCDGLSDGALADKIATAAGLLAEVVQEMRNADAFTFHCKDCGDPVEVEAVRCAPCVRKCKIEHGAVVCTCSINADCSVHGV